MKMISYAQNFEDVMLWRVLKHIPKGFYVDVGAWSPNNDSVTRHFYENGWNGINIEPNPEFQQQYLQARPKDINLGVALSDEIGIAEIYFVSNPGLSSLDKAIAQGHTGCTTIPSKVDVTTLQAIFSQYAPDQEIHFLKVDVEGLEKKVLLGNDWSKYCPWIVVVEATHPMSQVENYEEWEFILLEAHYLFAYADGLNRFYVAPKHKELLEAFKYPPNVFDDFVLAIEINLQNQVINIDFAAQKQAQELQKQISDLQAQYHSMISSRSWKITKPLRIIMDILRG